MKNKLLSYLLGSIFVLSMGFVTSFVYAQLTTPSTGEPSVSPQTTKEECKDGCCGIKLNTNFPGIGNCITYEKDKPNPTSVFQTMTGGLTKLVTSIILVVCFITIIIAGIIRAGAGEDSSQRTKAKKLIEKVAITILLLGFSGVILKLINPNFFG